ncbi:hypothetical protein MPNT_280004 [Candidatus Methylacidithermus pantelleriae]|uniref:Uncharacterized protein n=1 Tax=Candidatus Methylacidithermus pantelleriae TaxID=2744239 RepID=A0A8J2BT65_9BACT|nr:hypothetical protein MPNT_280004 [Candidatus Methylacidithermus pantelleriae]
MMGVVVREDVSRRWRPEQMLAGVRRERKRRLGKAIALGADSFCLFEVCVAEGSKGDPFGGTLWGRGWRTKGLGRRTSSTSAMDG